MKKQNEIKKTLSQAKVIAHIKELLKTEHGKSRAKLAHYLCKEYNFFDPAGKMQAAGCIKALSTIEKQAGLETFYNFKPKSKKTEKVNLRLDKSVPEPQNVPDTAGKIKSLKLIPVETAEQRCIWNELMINEHPRKAGHLVGRQIKYLISSDHGCLGGLAFSSAALHVEDRDKWVGWDWPKRQTLLHYIVNLSRFLIRPCVKCKNLASHILGMAVRQFPEDFYKKYNYRPLLLESFVDTTSHSGTCYKAANWELVGKTKGRGRQDSLCEFKETIKDIYIYKLDDFFREKFGTKAPQYLQPLPIESFNVEDWAKEEFSGVDIGDKRLDERLIQAAEEIYKNPSASYSACVGGDWKKVKGFYRLIDKPDDSAVSVENILKPHRTRTIQRIKAQKTVLCIQDGTKINYDDLNNCTGLGEIGKNQTKAVTKGFHMHSTMAVTTDGLPLGILSSEITSPKIQKIKRTKNEERNSSIETKKIFSWIKGIRDCMSIKKLTPETALVNVMDREGDFYELFDTHRNECIKIDLLVRAAFDRKINGDNKLFDKLRNTPASTSIEIEIPRQSQRLRRGTQKAKPKKERRTAKALVSFEKIRLKPPSYSKSKTYVELWAIHLREENPPENIDPVEWFLLTTINIESSETALECIKWYCLRWRIEDWHRVLKSGCKIEELSMKKAARLKRAIAINIVVAWRIMLMTLLGRQAPELPPEILFSDIEIKVLQGYAQKKT
jgi:hypothetical protein